MASVLQTMASYIPSYGGGIRCMVRLRHMRYTSDEMPMGYSTKKVLYRNHSSHPGTCFPFVARLHAKKL